MLYSTAHIHMMCKNGNSNHNSTKIHMYALHKNKNITFMRKTGNSNVFSLKIQHIRHQAKRYSATSQLFSISAYF